MVGGVACHTVPVPHESLGGNEPLPVVVIVVGVDAKEDKLVFV